MKSKERFSDRYGYISEDIEIKIWQDAPEELRGVLLDIAIECGQTPNSLRAIVCQILRKRPNPNNWSEYPNVWNEVQQLVDKCDWYRVYDIIEIIYETIVTIESREFQDSFLDEQKEHIKAETFKKEINDYFYLEGIGWKLNDEGLIEIRGAEAFEILVQDAQKTLDSVGKSTASNEIHQALHDLSRRPLPDLTGAIQHAMASLECVTRDFSGSKSTLGAILKKYPDLIPSPLDQSVDKMWGYASERARHLQQGNVPEFEEAELVVAVSASIANYLVKKHKKTL